MEPIFLKSSFSEEKTKLLIKIVKWTKTVFNKKPKFQDFLHNLLGSKNSSINQLIPIIGFEFLISYY